MKKIDITIIFLNILSFLFPTDNVDSEEDDGRYYPTDAAGNPSSEPTTMTKR